MIDKRITEFIEKHHVLTIASSKNNEPWCASCFYAYFGEEESMVFTSDGETRHGSEFRENATVAGAIVLETTVVGKIRGIQFQGEVFEPEGNLAKRAKRCYLKRFPFAVFMETHIWIVKLKKIKMTDNRLGFGRKLIWP